MIETGEWVDKQPPRILVDTNEFLLRAETSYLDVEDEEMGGFNSFFVFHVQLWETGAYIRFGIELSAEEPGWVNAVIAAEVAFDWLTALENPEPFDVQLRDKFGRHLEPLHTLVTSVNGHPDVMFRLVKVTERKKIDSGS